MSSSTASSITSSTVSSTASSVRPRASSSAAISAARVSASCTRVASLAVSSPARAVDFRNTGRVDFHLSRLYGLGEVGEGLTCGGDLLLVVGVDHVGGCG